MRICDDDYDDYDSIDYNRDQSLDLICLNRMA